MSDAPRIGVVGARRNRQGLGPYMARFFDQLGVDVAAVLGTSNASAAAAVAELGEAGMSPRPFADAEAFFADPELDAVVIASPHESHAPCLSLALEHGKHVLCEKPLVWSGADGADSVAEASRLVDGFIERNLLLRENVQWCYTLDAYWQLHPQPSEPVTSLGFLLGPAARGADRITDCLSHVISLLQALDRERDEPLRDIRFDEEGPDRLRVSFDYPGRRATIATEVELRHSPQPPRPAGYAIDGRWAQREIEPSTYAMSFRSEAGSQSVPVPDPMLGLIRDFAEDLRIVAAGGAVDHDVVPTGARSIVPRLAYVRQIYDAYPECTA